MYRVQPKGINIKQNDRNVPDGFLQESINLQWKDGAYRPIPERLNSGIDGLETSNKILIHKVSDEDVINVLSFLDDGYLYWVGRITNGFYQRFFPSRILTNFPMVTDFDSLSFTILNGLIYFMSSSQEFYYRIQFNEVDEAYEVKDMYAWKDLIPYYPQTGYYSGTIPTDSDTKFLVTLCGIVLVRFTLVLNTGEEVLHTPIYANEMYALNKSTSNINKDDPLTNIHALINTNLNFLDTVLLAEEVSAINIYTSIPFYKNKVANTFTGSVGSQRAFTSDDARGEIQIRSEEPFYLVKTIESPGSSLTDENVLFYIGEIDVDLDFPSNDFSRISLDSVAAGSVMPVDNFTYHRIYGKITSNNGRLIITKPKTVLSIGHMRSLSLTISPSNVGFYINTEDGDLEGISYRIDTEIDVTGNSLASRGLLSYPDSRASYVGGNEATSGSILLYKIRGNKAHNLSCAFNFENTRNFGIIVGSSGGNFTFSITYSIVFNYKDADIITAANPPVIPSIFYVSDNRLQFSEAGEFSVWPAINSYRVGEGKIIFTGSNSIDPSNSDYISPLLIGTSDGVYTVNFDVTGVQLIQSITRAANLPALSDKNILIDQNLIYVSDKGLIVINSGKVVNITKDYFPEQGDGNFPINNTVYPNYNLLTSNLSGDDYKLTDIIDYMKGALFAFDGRRNDVWCSNPDEDFSLIYNLQTKQWTMSTYVFKEVIDFNGIINTSAGEIYSRFLVRNKAGDLIDILSGEDLTTKVYTHLLTRPIKMQSAEQYKKIQRLMSRCELYRDDAFGDFTFGLWGKQDLNKDKVNIPLVAYEDNSSTAFPNNIRQNIPVGRMKGKYKTITILQGGYLLPNSSLDNFEIVAIPVENNILR